MYSSTYISTSSNVNFATANLRLPYWPISQGQNHVTLLIRLRIKFMSIIFQASFNFNFNKTINPIRDWINCIHLSSQLKAPKLLVSLYLVCSSTNYDNKLDRYLRSHNNALTATLHHRFINIYVQIFFTWNS